MAKENTVMLHGQVCTIPKIYYNNDGELIKAMYAVKILRRPMSGGKNSISKLYLDCPVVMTRKPEMIRLSSELQINDMVDIRAVLSTREVIKSTVCPKCGAKNSIKGVTTYLTPLYICKRESGITPEEGLELLKARSEVSNMIMVIGTLCRDPVIYTDPKGRSFAQYQLAVNRRYHILEDPVDKKTDYPWVKTAGDQAFKDSQALHMGSHIYINGAIQTRKVSRSTTCESCGAEYPWDDAALEIVPYSIEYLSDCDIPEKETEKVTENAKG